MEKQLRTLEFEFQTGNLSKKYNSPPKHYGVVGSGDLEMILTPSDLKGHVKFFVNTPLSGYDNVWEAVLQKFIKKNNISNIKVEINDNNATPAVVSLRLFQAFKELEGGADV